MFRILLPPNKTLPPKYPLSNKPIKPTNNIPNGTAQTKPTPIHQTIEQKPDPHGPTHRSNNQQHPSLNERIVKNEEETISTL